MGTKLAALAGCLLLAAQAAHSEISATVTGITDYDFRGISQTSGDPALQASIDYTQGLFYASVWGSNVDFGEEVDGSMEVDVVAGLTGESESGWRWDVGAVGYLYPNSSDSANKISIENYLEVYVGGGKGPVDVKLYYSPDLYNSNDSAYYLDTSLSFDMPADFGLGLHVGYNGGDYFTHPVNGANAYIDASVSITRSFGHFDFELKGVATDLPPAYEINSGANRNDARLILSVATTFPWSKEE